MLQKVAGEKKAVWEGRPEKAKKRLGPSKPVSALPPSSAPQLAGTEPPGSHEYDKFLPEARAERMRRSGM